MTAVHGSAARLYANGIDLTAFMREAVFGGAADTAEATTWGLYNKVYIPGKTDATLTGEGVWDSDQVNANKPDDILDAALGAAGVITFLPQGEGLGKRCRIVEAAFSTYEVTSPGDDVTSFSFEAQASSGGAGTGVILQPVAGALSIIAAGNGAAVDDELLAVPVATTFGGVAALQAINKGGGAGTLTVTVESSVNGTTGWAAVATFAGVTAKGAKQVVYTLPGVTINRFLRAAWAHTGGTWDISVAYGRRYQAGA